jgi:hypothetical protein
MKGVWLVGCLGRWWFLEVCFVLCVGKVVVERNLLSLMMMEKKE